MNSAKNIYLTCEGDAYFARNSFPADDDVIIDKFTPFDGLMSDLSANGSITLLEIGCAGGHNIHYLSNKYGFDCYGIDPSKAAITAGAQHYQNKLLHFAQGTSDELPYPDYFFDIIIVGFCLYSVDRSLLFKTVSEIDRVLKYQKYLLIDDYDTVIPYIRENKHNKDLFTYKMNYSKLFLANPQYFLVAKSSYSCEPLRFSPDMQERRSTTLLFKDTVENTYVRT